MYFLISILGMKVGMRNDFPIGDQGWNRTPQPLSYPLPSLGIASRTCPPLNLTWVLPAVSDCIAHHEAPWSVQKMAV